jgi:hypothetical protein
LRNQYRITKYDPSFRDDDGAFRREDWTSYSDVGHVFNGITLSESEYLRVEAAYLFAIEACLHDANIESLFLTGLENSRQTKLPKFVQDKASLTVTQCINFARFVLRDLAWGKLILPGRAYVHFGYDYYMYLGLPSHCRDAIAAVSQRGLFVEPFRSPYLRQRPSRS